MAAMLALLDTGGQVPMASLARELGASEATIRRDVVALTERGLVERTHGGARLTKRATGLPFRVRNVPNQELKTLIAESVPRLIPAGRYAIGLTGGTTTVEVLKALGGRDDLTIITNSISIGLAAAEQGQERVLVAGGVLRADSLELVGSLAESTLGMVQIQTAVVGADGISSAGGLTTRDEVEARTNRIFITRAQRVIAVADSSKIGRVLAARTASLSEIDTLVTDSLAPDSELAAIRSAGVEVLVVPAAAKQPVPRS